MLSAKGRHQKLYIVKIDGGGGKIVYLFIFTSEFPLLNSAVKTDGGEGDNVKIGNFPGILMSSLMQICIYMEI